MGVAGRRARVLWLVATFVAANAVTAGFLVAWADRHALRFDVTATGEHRLADQTRRLLDAGGPGGFELVVAADTASVDPRAWQALLDVAAELERAGPLRLTTLTGERGRGGLIELGRRLADREREAIERQERILRRAADDLRAAADIAQGELADTLGGLGEAFQQAGGGERYARELASRAAAAPTLAADLRQTADAAQAALDSPLLDGVDAPALDRARSALSAPARGAADQLALLVREARRFEGDPALGEGVRRGAERLASRAERARALCAAAAVAAEGLEVLDVVRVLRAAGGSTVAIVVGDASAVAIDAATLLPPPGTLAEASATPPVLRTRAEALISSALLTLVDPLRPIVVFTHGEPSRFAERPEAYAFAFGHFRRRGIDVIEWPVMLEDEPPGLVRLDPSGARPVVYVVRGTDGRAGGGQAVGMDGATRAAELASVVSGLVDRGAAVLLSLSPSEAAIAGATDPLARVVDRFGLTARTGLAVLTRGGEGQGVLTDAVARARDAGDHPIAGAIAGLPTYLPWPVPIERPDEAAGGGATRLLGIDDEAAWAEGAWAGFRRVPRERRATVTDPPAPGGAGDEDTGPWPVAWAAERTLDGGRRGRLVVVGSNDWFIDLILRSGGEVDGRLVADYPGNLALLDASVQWLAGRDAFIAPTATSTRVAMIGELSPVALAWLRWGLVLGLPGLILAAGGLWRVIGR